ASHARSSARPAPTADRSGIASLIGPGSGAPTSARGWSSGFSREIPAWQSRELCRTNACTGRPASPPAGDRQVRRHKEKVSRHSGEDPELGRRGRQGGPDESPGLLEEVVTARRRLYDSATTERHGRPRGT